MLAGAVEHQDSLGNKGLLGSGDIQWMTAGSGILHQEMPQGDPRGRMHGFQLWANLPSSLKMTKPRYQDVPARDVPEVVEDDGTTIRVLCGSFGGKTGPVEGIAADPRYLDVSVPAGRRKRLAVDVAQHAFAYVFAGSGIVPRRVRASGRGDRADRRRGDAPAASRRTQPTDPSSSSTAATKSWFAPGSRASGSCSSRDRPIEEPIAWYGPIVMNTEEELLQAQRELQGRDVHQK